MNPVGDALLVDEAGHREDRRSSSAPKKTVVLVGATMILGALAGVADVVQPFNTRILGIHSEATGRHGGR
jgi:hypothetical protein